MLLENAAQQMWGDYMARQFSQLDKEDIEPSSSEEKFWETYQELIEQSKLRSVYSELQLNDMVSKNVDVSQIFYEHWDATFVANDYVMTRKQSVTGVSSGVVFVLGVLVIFPVAYMCLGSTLGAMLLVGLLLSAVTSVNKNSKNKQKVKLKKTLKGEAVFTPEKLIYRKLYNQALHEIEVPYALMYGLWHDNEGLTIVGEKQQKLWKGHRVTLSPDIDNWAEVHEFLQEVVSYNKLKKFDKLAAQK